MKYILTALFASILAFSLSSPAQAGLIEFLFPSLKRQQYNPYETMKAPFATPEEEERIKNKPQNLSIPHRTNGEISSWLVDSISDIMTFDSGEYKKDLRADEHYFDQNGMSAFNAFLQDSSLLKVLESGQYNIRSVVEGVPLLLNEGNVDGRYRWLYEADVMVTYMKKSMQDYKNVTPVTQKFSITLQLGRFPEEVENEHNILIETWSGKELKTKKEK